MEQTAEAVRGKPMPLLGEGNPLLELAARARRRSLANLAVERTAVALTAGMTGVVLLLLLGTQIFDWHWPLLLFVGGLVAGVFRLTRRIPSTYRLLQLIDGRLRLRDTLSTAFYFLQLAGSRNVSGTLRKAQREEACRISRTVDPRRAAPLTIPAAAYAAAGVALIAGGLFAVRYGVRHSLDLRPPISEAVVEFFRPSPELAELSQPAPPLPEYSPAGMLLEQSGDGPGESDAEAGSALSAGEAPDYGDAAMRADYGTENLPEGWDVEESYGSDGGQAGEEAPSSAPPARNAPPSEQRRSPPPREEDSDLIQKMRDAMANLLSRLKIQPPLGDGRRWVSAPRTTSGTARSELAEGQNAREGSGRSLSDGMPSPDAQGDSNSPGGQQARAGQGETSEQPGRDQNRSGAGTQEGDKDVKLAQQLEAMGKLSEILGRRAENITGEVMLEVPSGDQRLRTAYSETSAAHKAAGGEIHRDEVPLALRDYVQRYFEEVRKGDEPLINANDH